MSAAATHGERAGPPAAGGEPAPSAALATSSGLARPLALLAVLAHVLGRALAPALAGTLVGIGPAIRTAERVGAALSQLLALLATVLAISQILALGRTRHRALVRGAAVVLGGGVVIATMMAAASPIPSRRALVEAFAGSPASRVLTRALPDPSLALGVGSALLALVGALAAMRAPRARAAALVVGLAGLSALLHTTGLALADHAAAHGVPRFALAARSCATFSLGADALALAVALVWAGTRARGLVHPGTLLALGVAYLVTVAALRGGAVDAATHEVLARRALDRLLARPEPAASLGVRFFLEAAAPVIATVVVLTRRQLPGVLGVIALAILARPTTDVPLPALLLTVAALTVPVVAVDDRGLWASLLRHGPSPPAGT